jgi:bifunctional DNA-binding transcriptional regulator/antitoxin component of YhaV-PrlF toxin-antitoxin module
MTLPSRLRSALGVGEGDVVEPSAQRGKIVLTPKFPNVDDEYTPEHRRAVDGRLTKAMAEVKKGNVSPAFETIAEFAAALRADAKKLRAKSKDTAR